MANRIPTSNQLLHCLSLISAEQNDVTFLVCCPALLDYFSHSPVILTLILTEHASRLRICRGVGVRIAQEGLEKGKGLVSSTFYKIKANLTCNYKVNNIWQTHEQICNAQIWNQSRHGDMNRDMTQSLKIQDTVIQEACYSTSVLYYSYFKILTYFLRLPFFFFFLWLNRLMFCYFAMSIFMHPLYPLYLQFFMQENCLQCFFSKIFITRLP